MAAKQAVIYVRVSSETQAGENRVSIGQQLAECQKLCESRGWQIAGIFRDDKRYRKTKNPKKGKFVQPSGEYNDRPAFLEMLALIETGQIDAVVCWRDDRLVRHPRVNVAIEDSSDLGDRQRNEKIQIFDATGATLDRFTMSIKAAVWKEENKRRAERIRLGKVGTLQAGGWPGPYDRLGYDAIDHEGRGKKIILNESEAQTVRDIFDWYDSGLTQIEISQKLALLDRPQKGRDRKHEWSPCIIGLILRAEDYTGHATWTFSDGQAISIDIPRIVEPEQFKRIGRKLDANVSTNSPRNTRHVFPLQHIAYCGECGGKISPSYSRYFYKTLADGTRKRYEYRAHRYRYRCTQANKYPNEQHPNPRNFEGWNLDDQVWQFIANKIIKHPELIKQQVRAEQDALQAEGDDLDGKIAQAERKLTSLESERAVYIRQNGRGLISDQEFEMVMSETKQKQDYYQTELDRLGELRDDALAIDSELETAFRLLNNIERKLSELNHDLEQLKAMTRADRDAILSERQQIIRSLCKKIRIFADGNIKIDGMVDHAPVSHFDEVDYLIDLSNLRYQAELKLHSN